MKKQPRKVGRIAPPPPSLASREFYFNFGNMDQDLARKVAEEVKKRCIDAPRRARVLVDVALLDIGDEEGFAIRYGYQLLKAGRYLLSNGSIRR